jgi:phosphoribosylformimino-5-aminoimidazole carboxamide ribotide isomerase
LDQGAAAVIVTSYVFHDGRVLAERLQEMLDLVGRDRLVIDLSCSKRGDSYYVVTDRWQKFTDVKITPETLDYFSRFCFEFLIHAADVEGRCQGIAEDMVADLGAWTPLPTTYAGGVRDMADLLRIRELGGNRLDVTVGSSLDIFGGSTMKYRDAVAFNRQQETT